MFRRTMRFHFLDVVATAAFLVVTASGTAQQGTQPPAKGATPNKPGSAAAKPQTTPDKTVPGKTEGKMPAKTAGETKDRLITYTFDGVKIEGTFYPALEDKGRKTPCLILLHAVGTRHLAASRKDFDKLPEKLQKLGYAVVTFDFRGYGESKTVNTQDFLRYNRIAKTKNPEHIEAKDYQSSMDLLNLVNDLVAVKVWLNKKNNSGDCNSNVVGIVAVEQSAIVATAFVANELTDPNRSKDKKTSSAVFIPGVGTVQSLPTSPNGNLGAGGGLGSPAGRMEGEDIACLVCVSSSNRLHEAIPMNVMEYWMAAIRDRHVPMLALYGANDRDAATFWSKAVTWVKPPREKDRYRNSGAIVIRNTSLAGTKLLLNETLDVNKSLETYFQDTLKKVGEARIWTEQSTETPSPVDIQRLFR
jgi:hypothetical protein